MRRSRSGSDGWLTAGLGWVCGSRARCVSCGRDRRGAVGAAPAPGGRIVFESSLPIYPLPDNFQAQRHFSIRFDGRARREIHPPLQWIWSRGVTRVFFARDGSMGAEVWAEGADGTRAHRLAVLRGSGRVESLDVSPDGSRLTSSLRARSGSSAPMARRRTPSSRRQPVHPCRLSPGRATARGCCSSPMVSGRRARTAAVRGASFPRRPASRSATRRPLTALRSS